MKMPFKMMDVKDTERSLLSRAVGWDEGMGKFYI